MTDWATAGGVPDESALRIAFRAALADRLAWRVQDDRLGREEADEVAAWRAELAAPIETGVRRVSAGIKLNAELTLAVRGDEARVERRWARRSA